MAHYAHTQQGNAMRLTALLPLAVSFAFPHLQPDAPPAARLAMSVGMALAALAILAFSSLTIEADPHEIRWFFGPRLWRKRIALADVAAVRQVRNEWWHGFGVHYTPHGWLYNVGGLDAVEIETHSGRTLRLGTDEPGELARALAALRYAG